MPPPSQTNWYRVIARVIKRSPTRAVVGDVACAEKNSRGSNLNSTRFIPRRTNRRGYAPTVAGVSNKHIPNAVRRGLTGTTRE
jgi:hypothetical protein